MSASGGGISSPLAVNGACRDVSSLLGVDFGDGIEILGVSPSVSCCSG